MHQWFTLEEVAQKQKACPLSIGQAEAGRYTYCVGEACMAWKWNQDQVKAAENNIITVETDNIPKGYEPCSLEYQDDDDNMVVDVMKKPTHGRCGMLP